MMKITNREKVLLSVLLVVSIIASFYVFVYEPSMNKISALEIEASEARQKEENTKRDIDSIEEKRAQYEKLDDDVYRGTQRIFPVIHQEKILAIINKLLLDADIKALSITFTELEVGGIEKKERSKDLPKLPLDELVDRFKGKTAEKGENTDSNTENEDGEQQSQEKKEDSGNNSSKGTTQKMTATISIKGTYEKIIQLLKQIESYEKEIIVKSLSINSEGKPELSGNIVLDFYAIPKIHDQDEKYLKWEYSSPYSTDNPFSVFQGYSSSVGTNVSKVGTKSNREQLVNKAVQMAEQMKFIEFDFSMVLSPMSADVPSVILGRSNDISGKSLLWAKNSEYEDVEIQMIQKDNKYYYKYRLEESCVPENYSEDMIEFQPKDKTVNMYVVSSPRNQENDYNGAYLSVINHTDLTFNIYVNHEDKVNPRLKIGRREGKVNIKSVGS